MSGFKYWATEIGLAAFIGTVGGLIGAGIVYLVGMAGA